MKVISNEMRIYYDPHSSVGKKIMAYARSIVPYINDVEYHKTKITSTTWKQLLEMLQLRPKDLLNKSHPYYQEHIRGRNFDEEGWLNILIQNPDLIIAPIAVKGKKAVLCQSPTDIYRVLRA